MCRSGVQVEREGTILLSVLTSRCDVVWGVMVKRRVFREDQGAVVPAFKVIIFDSKAY